jgi:geranylgeranyl diphosphate synthase, type II
MSLSDYLIEQQKLIDRALDRLTPSETTQPETIHRAMRYSLFAGGKRIRPILCMESAKAVSEAPEGIEDAASALEFVHTYSLIHDDLPALDNDDLRRGRPTCHKVFGEAIAILAGDALLTLAFQVLSQLGRADLAVELALAAGTVHGMIAGQVDDLECAGKDATAEILETIHRAKTGALLRASLRIGAKCANANEEQLLALTCYGEHVGLCFQIVDDVLDVEQSSAALGKTAGKDAAQKKITFPSLYGLEQSRKMAEQERERAHASLAPFGSRGARLKDLADLIARRQA